MKQSLIVVFAVAALLAVLTTACQHAGQEFTKQAQCIVNGSGCNSVNMDDPNLRGATGSTGGVGPVGPSGERGLPGPGEPFSFVQLCPGTSTYPSVFVEYAICTGGSLYAVYSPKATMILMLPGHWGSESLGSSCSFNVLPNCVVTP